MSYALGSLLYRFRDFHMISAASSRSTLYSLAPGALRRGEASVRVPVLTLGPQRRKRTGPAQHPPHDPHAEHPVLALPQGWVCGIVSSRCAG